MALMQVSYQGSLQERKQTLQEQATLGFGMRSADDTPWVAVRENRTPASTVMESHTTNMASNSEL
eukprot:2412432-Amphidinium_carterae.1